MKKLLNIINKNKEYFLFAMKFFEGIQGYVIKVNITMILIDVFGQNHGEASTIFSFIVGITAIIPLICAFINDYFIRSVYLILAGTSIMFFQYLLVIPGIDNISLGTYILFCSFNSIAVPIFRTVMPNYVSDDSSKNKTQKQKIIGYLVAATNLGIFCGIILSTRIFTNISSSLFFLMLLLMTINLTIATLIIKSERMFHTKKILQDNIKSRLLKLSNIKQLFLDLKDIKDNIFYITPGVLYFILYEQKFSTLLIQAKSMNCNSSFFNIKYSDVLLFSGIFASLTIFAWNRYFYDKLVSKGIINNPIDAISFGANFAIVSATISLILQILLDFNTSIHIYWQFLNYTILTIGDSIVYTVGISFAYNEISKKNRALSGSLWHLIVCSSALLLGLMSKLLIKEKCDYKIFLASLIIILIAKYLFIGNAQKYNIKNNLNNYVKT